MHVNVFGIIVIVLGVLLIFLGVTGKYQAFVGAQTSTNSTSSQTAQQQQQQAATNAGLFQAFGAPPIGALQAGAQGFVAGVSQGGLVP